jgi:hypothetical protein
MTPTLTTAEAREEIMETPYITIWREGNVLCCRYADNLHLSIEIARTIVENRIFYSKGQSYPVLVDMRGIKSTTREARSYMATVGATLVTAGALITGSYLNRALGNLFLTIDKPPIPTRLFNSEASARKWLEQFV